MASFKYYNVQILPLENNGKMIGVEGYKSIFTSLKDKVDEYLEKKNLLGISHNLRNDFFLSPESVFVRDDIAYGTIMKYDNVEKVFGTLDNQEKYVSSGGDSSKKYIFRFVFDFNKHILAIEKSKGLPSVGVLSEAIIDFLDAHRQAKFPEYKIHVIEMTNSESLVQVIQNAESYKRVQVEVTFSNSEDWSDALEEEILKSVEQEMKDKQIDSLVHIEKAANKSVMSEPTKSAMAYLGLACKFGNASIRYKDKLGKTETYRMTDAPIVLPVKEREGSKVKSELDFALDVKSSINKANELALNAKKLFNILRKGINNAKGTK
ncbi:DUF4747 family protein [Vibrio cholerae]|uniref:DUF4747 family protein n=1 Tax=Vibrio cholerae TaxID=666 RepID=UPI0018F1079F|nr:DUF4747 family protein [Vibrio cholerae]MBY8269653.1 DUF4747 family protein [Vibrio fluvialis]ELP3388005.1 DUF4747 family protein [Vibrio cholerae]ELR9910584.1 DUF4747 family protein [Vibrio cholerae]MBJ6945311.1 DUF4747 family protein [Vibrio cholerae]MCD1238555.1 hypothetical protein [Vibrio cholerae]